ncbi:MAG: alpha-ketoglutarate-dependent dioxygenase AlkB, partial [Lentisphaeraceae bacterium]|nr:alpha-ketoglutarate-dependent dioxygenase AlkB [Lentisphaeraceae bacterium]
GRNPIIASISLGAERRFVIRALHEHLDKLTLKLPHASLLLMQGTLQHTHEHQVPKEKTIQGVRVNLTFRQIK